MNELTAYWCRDKEVGSYFISIITGQRHIMQVEVNLNYSFSFILVVGILNIQNFLFRSLAPMQINTS